MRKLVLLATILVSVNNYALTNGSAHKLNSTVMASFHNHAGVSHENIKLYGGRNFSRSLLSDANETIWSGQPALNG